MKTFAGALIVGLTLGFLITFAAMVEWVNDKEIEARGLFREGYRQGQVDALLGKQHYRIIQNPDSTLSCLEIMGDF